MMGGAGCYIRYNYNLEDVKINKQNASIGFDFKSQNLESCANYCFNDDKCKSGWSYQIATRRCITFETANMTAVQPGSLLNAIYNNNGWISGVKSCRSFVFFSFLFSINSAWFQVISKEFVHTDGKRDQTMMICVIIILQNQNNF